MFSQGFTKDLDQTIDDAFPLPTPVSILTDLLQCFFERGIMDESSNNQVSYENPGHAR